MKGVRATAKSLELGNHSNPEAIEELYKSSEEKHDRERLLAVLMGYERKTLAEIGSSLRRGRATVARWIRAYREGGIKQLLNRGHGGGSPASLSESHQEALVDGLLSGQWKRAKDIQMWLQSDHGIDLKLGGVYYWLGKLKGSWKVPRPRHKDQDTKEAEQFKEEIVSRLEALDIPDDRPVHIWIEDEHRYGLISVLRRCWTIRGHRVTVSLQRKYKWGYVYGAADMVTGDAEFLYTPAASLEWTEAFLNQLVAKDPDAIHIVIWDGAGYHPEVLHGNLSESIRFLPLPAYSPELNPIEPLWDQVKLRIANDVWETLDAIESAISEVLEPFWKHKEKVWSLLGNTWLTRGVITFLQHRLE